MTVYGFKYYDHKKRFSLKPLSFDDVMLMFRFLHFTNCRFGVTNAIV